MRHKHITTEGTVAVLYKGLIPEHWSNVTCAHVATAKCC